MGLAWSTLFAVSVVVLAAWAGWCKLSLPPLQVPPTPGKPFKAVVLGGSGACGQALVRQLVDADDVTEITLISRRVVAAFESSKKVHQRVCDLDDTDGLTKKTELLKGHDIAFSLLGVGAAAKVSKAKLLHVDVSIPNAFAEAARMAGVKHMSIMTAVGANSSTPDSGETTHGGSGTYNQVKGMVEDAMVRLEFPGSLRIFRPAAILGTPHTPTFLAAIGPWLQPFLPATYRFSHVDEIAKGMISEARNVLNVPLGAKVVPTKVFHVPDYTALAGIQI